MTDILNPISGDLFDAVYVVLFCSDEDEFPEHAPKRI